MDENKSLCNLKHLRRIVQTDGKNIKIEYYCKKCRGYIQQKDLLWHFGYVPPITFEEAGSRNYPPGMLYK